MSDLTFEQLKNGKPVRLEKKGQAICVTQVGDEIFAIADSCSHAEAALSEGDVTGTTIECWLHGAEFDLKTGQALTLPATNAVQTFAISRGTDGITVEV